LSGKKIAPRRASNRLDTGLPQAVGRFDIGYLDICPFGRALRNSPVE